MFRQYTVNQYSEALDAALSKAMQPSQNGVWLETTVQKHEGEPHLQLCAECLDMIRVMGACDSPRGASTDSLQCRKLHMCLHATILSGVQLSWANECSVVTLEGSTSRS